jgi:hypothetical protein
MALLQTNVDLSLFWWFCYEGSDGNNVVAFLCGDGNSRFFFFWSLWFNSFELIINNEMVVFLMLRVVMGRGRRLKKGGLVVQKKNVAS